jgi:putative sterol carrier protein
VEVTVAKYPFLSPEWIDAAREIRDEMTSAVAPSGDPVRINLVVTEVPFGDGSTKAHLETRPGILEVEEGHVADAHTTVTIDYATAREIFVGGNVQAGMQAFMTGRIRVEGDLTRLLAAFPMGESATNPLAAEAGRRLRDITEGLEPDSDGGPA